MTDKVRIMPWDNGVFMRIFSPRGNSYRAEPFLHPDAVYLAQDRFVVSVVKQHRRNQSDTVSEMVWIYPEEVRLLATLALSVPEGHGAIRFIPSHRIALDFPSDAPLHSDEILAEIQDKAIRLAEVHSLKAFDLAEWKTSSIDFQLDVFDSIDPSDDLLIRGLYCLLKAGRLMAEPEFGEEGYMNVSIAREAVLEVIRQHLEATGTKNPSFRDAHRYIEENFLDGNHLADFLVYQHDTWVETKHPNSAFGPVWMPQLMADDLYESYECLVSVYRHVLSGEPGRSSAFEYDLADKD